MSTRCLMRLPGLRAPFPGLVSWIVVRPSPSQTRPRCPGWIDLPILPPSALSSPPISTVSLCLYFVAADCARSLARSAPERNATLKAACALLPCFCFDAVFLGRAICWSRQGTKRNIWASALTPSSPSLPLPSLQPGYPGCRRQHCQ